MIRDDVDATSCTTARRCDPETPPQRNVRFALIGCGAIAEQMHLPVLAGHEGIELAALVDRDRSRAAKLAKGYRAKAVLDDASQLDPSQIDAAIIATPPFHHAPCAIALIERGIHVLVEKPMATCYADALRMVEAAEKAGVTLAVGFFRRLYPNVRLLKALLETHWLGRPTRFEAEGGGMYNWPAATLGNMRKDWAGGGVLIDFGSHVVDLLLSLFDDPAEVLDYRDNALGGVEADCSIRLRLSHRGACIEGSVELARARNLGCSIRVECERGTLAIELNDPYIVQVTPKAIEAVDAISRQAAPFRLKATWDNVQESSHWGYALFRQQIDDWLEAIRARRQPALSGRSALPASRLIEQCYQRSHGTMAEPWVATWDGSGVARQGSGLGAQRSGFEVQRSGVATPAQPETKDACTDASPSSNDPTVQQSIHPAIHSSLTPRPSPLTPNPLSGSRRVLVTGATGFIGCRAAEILHLRDGWQVRALVHDPGNASRLARLPVEMVQGDLGSEESAKRLVDGCEAVVHCAVGTVWGNRRRNFAINVDGSRRLAEAALAAGVRRFVHFSTMSVYGNDSLLTGTLDESTPVKPARGSDYGESKGEAERIILRTAQRGLPAVVFRPARVFGPFSRIFITRPIMAIAKGGFHWLGSPDVPCDMVYVDNVVEAVVRALESPAENVRGEVLNISDGDAMTWREFYAYFAERLGLDLSRVPIDPPATDDGGSLLSRVCTWPVSWIRGVKTVVTSTEFKSLGRRVLATDPLGTLPRWTLASFPICERAARKIVGADGSLPLYRREPAPAAKTCEMGSGGALLSIERARRVLGYEPIVSRPQAQELTLEWIRHARLAH